MSKTDGKEKRARSFNYSVYEIELLLSEVGKHKAVLENKSKEQASNNAKDQAWKEIWEAFNSDPRCPNPRTVEQLSLKWQNLKKEARRAIGTYSREKRATGGGPPPTEVPSVYRKIQELLPHEFNRINCAFDDDAITSGPDSPAIEAPIPTPPMIIVGSPSVASSPVMVETIDTDSAPETKPVMVQSSTPRMPPKKRARPSTSAYDPAESVSDLECMQKEFLAYRKECAEAEHEAKMRMLCAEHSLRMQGLEWEVKANMAKEQYWREGGPQRPVYTQPTPMALPGVDAFFNEMDKPC